jgi:hypothetical protein
MYAARKAILQRYRNAVSSAYFPADRVRVTVVAHRPAWWSTRTLDDDNL